jgi:uncharacterized protein with gpF-like domain
MSRINSDWNEYNFALKLPLKKARAIPLVPKLPLVEGETKPGLKKAKVLIIPPKMKSWTPEQQSAIWKTFDGKAKEGERAFSETVQEVAKSQKAAFKKALGSGIDVEAAITKTFTKTSNLAFKMMLAPAWFMSAKRGYDIAEDVIGKSTKKDVTSSWDIVNPLVREWIDTNGLLRAEGINDTTLDLLRLKIAASLAEGVAAGEGRGQLSSRILDATDDVYEDMDRNRANLIARTETCATVNWGQVQTYKVEGVEKKEWLATQDERTRDDHIDADKQLVGIDEDFEIGGDAMQAPGLGSDASQNCNCRCTILPVIPEGGLS